MQVLRRLGRNGKNSPLTASAARVSVSQLTRRRMTRTQTDWQPEVWRHYDLAGELYYGTTWLANSLSRVKLFVVEGDVDVTDPVRVDSGPEVDYLNQLCNGPGGQAELLRMAGIHLTVPGEMYLVSYKDPDTGATAWVTASIDELTRKNGDEVLDRGDGRPITITDDDYVLRVWRPHARRWWRPDSPAHHALPVLAELEALSKGILNSIDSRLAGAGLLLLPNDITLPNAAMPDNAQSEDPFMANLIDAMTAPLSNPDSAASVVPMVLRGPAESIREAKLLKFHSPLDGQTNPLREAAIKRLAVGLDTPPEALLGYSDSNHWSAWMISEEGVKLSIEPVAGTLCDALTTGYLWPLMEGDTKRTIWYDASALTQRPDRGPDAQALWEAQEISGAVYRRERGFGEEDAPDPAERRDRYLLDLVKVAPDLAPQILPLVGMLREGDIITVQAIPGAPEETPPIEEPATGPPAEAPSGPPPAAASILIPAEMAVLRALELAGKRLLWRDARQSLPSVPAWELHMHMKPSAERADKAMSGVWDMLTSTMPELAHLVPVLDRYVRGLLATGTAHCRMLLEQALEEELGYAST